MAEALSKVFETWSGQKTHRIRHHCLLCEHVQHFNRNQIQLVLLFLMTLKMFLVCLHKFPVVRIVLELFSSFDCCWSRGAS